VADAATYVTEMLVGLACLALAVSMRRRPGPARAVQILFAVAGLAAVVHATVGLVTR
jgi:peptidoglycan/LPS O-acetylase OafA/YrhL